MEGDNSLFEIVWLCKNEKTRLTRKSISTKKDRRRKEGEGSWVVENPVFVDYVLSHIRMYSTCYGVIMNAEDRVRSFSGVRPLSNSPNKRADRQTWFAFCFINPWLGWWRNARVKLCLADTRKPKSDGFGFTNWNSKHKEVNESIEIEYQSFETIIVVIALSIHITFNYQ